MKTFIIERDILTKMWSKEHFKVEGEDLADAINKFKSTPEGEKYYFENSITPLYETEVMLESDIVYNNCHEIPTQSKLEM